MLQRKKNAISMLSLSSIFSVFMAIKQGILFLYYMTIEKKQSNHLFFVNHAIWYKSLSISDNNRKLCFDNSTRFSKISTYLLIYKLFIFLNLTKNTYFQLSSPVIEISQQKIGVKNIWFVLNSITYFIERTL